MIDKSKLSPSMEVEFDEEKGAYKVTNISQGESFYTSEDLLHILESGKSFYRKKGNNYFVCDNYYGERKYFHQIAMQDEINAYREKYNTEPSVDHKDRDIDNNSSSNLRVLSKRANMLNTEKGDKLEYFGVLGGRMYITDPYNNVRLEDHFQTNEEAAEAYDYYVSIYYPNEIEFSNIETNRYPEGYLESKGINGINDIKLPKSNRDIRNERCSNIPYYDIEYYGHAGAEIMARVHDNDDRGSYPIDYGGYSKLIHLIANREVYLENHSDECKGNSNVAYHEPQNGKTIIAGIIVEENEDHVLK